MMTEDDWVAAMAAAPTDGLIMGAFADWLDERGDNLRAEFYRLLWETGKVGRPDSSSYSYWSLLSVPDDWRVPARLWNAADDGQASLYQKSPAQSRVLLATAWAGATEADRARWTEYMRLDAGLPVSENLPE